jgi:hypothetical protein
MALQSGGYWYGVAKFVTGMVLQSDCYWYGVEE